VPQEDEMRIFRSLAIALALLLPAACSGNNNTPSAAPESSQSATPTAPASPQEKNEWPCTSVDVAAVNEIFGDKPAFKDRGSAMGVLPIKGAITCTFHDPGYRTVTVSGASNVPNEYESYVKSAKSEPTVGTKFEDLVGIGDHAVGAASNDMAAEVILESGNNLAVVVCIDTKGHAGLYEHCKELATRIAS
jgi:hypothetical protein